MLRTATYTIPKEPWAAWWKRAESRLDARGAARIRSSQLPAVGAAPAVRSGPAETTPDARDVVPLRSLALPAPGDGPPAAEVDCGSVGVWDNGSLALPTPGPWAGAAHAAVWTGNLMLAWLPSRGTGGRYDPVLDSWSTASSLGAPVALTDERGQWTGEEMSGRPF